MRKTLTAILAAVLCVVFLAGCGDAGVSNTLLPDTRGIEHIFVSTMPQMHEGTLTGEKAVKLAEYILDMDVQAEFSEDPNVYTGMTWVLAVNYEDGSTVTVEFFGNLFIRADAGSWQKVSQQEAQGLEALLKELQ